MARIVKNVFEIYGEMPVYPYASKEAGFKNIGEVVVNTGVRKYGVSQ